MATIQQSTHDIQLKTTYFFKLVHLSEVLRQANAQKRKGIKITSLFQWIILSIFQRYSLHRAEADPSFSKRTARNCLNDARINWQRLVLLVAVRLVNISISLPRLAVIKPSSLTIHYLRASSPRRPNYFPKYSTMTMNGTIPAFGL